MWVNWHSAKDSNRSPSSLIGLIEGSYEAYCYDQAAWYVVNTVQNEVDKVGEKKAKGQAAQESAKNRKLRQMLGQGDTTAKGQYADPSALFASEGS